MNIKMYYLAWGETHAICGRNGARIDKHRGEYDDKNLPQMLICDSLEELQEAVKAACISDEYMNKLHQWHIQEVDIEI